jgi:hypothetical protein
MIAVIEIYDIDFSGVISERESLVFSLPFLFPGF